MVLYRQSLALALIAAATLTAEVALTRILSVGLFHHFAFVVVSTAMFGGAAGGLVVVLRTRWRSRAGTIVAGRASAAFAVGLPVAYSLSQLIPLEPLALGTEPRQALWLALVYVLLTAPFAASGVAVAVTLDRNAREAPRLYAADLAGASAGCFIALGALHLGPSGLYVSAALALTAAWQFGLGERATAALGVAVGVAAVAAPLPLHISASKVTAGGQPYDEVFQDHQQTLRTDWGPLGRVDLVRFRRGRRVILDAGVAAVRVPPVRPAYAPSDVTLPYELNPKARVLIIGAGAGWEVGEALAYGAAFVDAVEINPQVAAHVPAPLRRDPRTAWHLTDGRAFVHQTPHTYDAIVLIHTISNAATAAGALRLAEDYLLTVEALAAMLTRLKEGGLLLLTRPEAQLPALLNNLRQAGVQPPQVVSWAEPVTRGGFYGAVLVRRATEWPPELLERVRIRLRQRKLRLLFDPERGAVDPTADPSLAQVMSTRSTSNTGTGPRVATDDRPFFHQHRRWRDIAAQDVVNQQGRWRLALEDAPLAEASVVLLLAQTTAMAAVVLLVPLALDPSRRRHDTVRLAAYFSALGLGFMLVEVALVQRLGLLLGSPTLAFAVVFAGLLAGTAGGSRLAQAWRWPRHAPAVAGAVVAAAMVTLPPMVEAALPLADPWRIGLALLVVGGCGLALGLPFPVGLRAVAEHPGAAAWALAFNGVASVAGTSLAILVGAQFGLTASTGLALAAYIVAWMLMPGPTRRP